MNLNKFIYVEDNFVDIKTISKIVQFASRSNFLKACVGSNNNVDFTIRKTYEYPLNNFNESMTAVHWYNYLHYTFCVAHQKYKKFINVREDLITRIMDVIVLKYKDNGFYNYHVDHFADCPRTLSFILLLNNDYEGGQLCFRNPDTTGEKIIDVKPGRMIVWPSNFQYPHTVKPVKKGVRFSIVSWGL